jgi:hypothetical protein
VSAGGGEVWIQSLAAQGRKYLREASRHLHLRITNLLPLQGVRNLRDEVSAESAESGGDAHGRWRFKRRAVGVRRRPYTVSSPVPQHHVVCPPPWPRQA